MAKQFVFFKPGELVQLKQDIHKPIMVVKKISKSRSRIDKDDKDSDTKSNLLGVLCFWFTEDFTYQEKLFSSKDLERVE